MNIAMLIFEDVEELDFVGPWEVFTLAATLLKAQGKIVPTSYLVSEGGGIVTCSKGMRVESHHSFATAPAADILLVPGGRGTRREIRNAALLGWIAAQAENCRYVTSVCTGSLLLAAAGPARGRRITTHWLAKEDVRKRVWDVGFDVDFAEGRWIVDGPVVSAAGVSAGIDMALWLVGELFGEDVARAVTAVLEYDPAPPFPFAATIPVSHSVR